MPPEVQRSSRTVMRPTTRVFSRVTSSTPIRSEKGMPVEVCGASAMMDPFLAERGLRDANLAAISANLKGVRVSLSCLRAGQGVRDAPLRNRRTAMGYRVAVVGATGNVGREI